MHMSVGSLIPCLSRALVAEASGVWGLQEEEGYKRQDRRPRVLDSEPLHSGDPPRPLSPGPAAREGIVLCPGL